MPQFWKIEYSDRTRWINPAHIAYVEDYPNADPPIVRITMVAVTTAEKPDKLQQSTLEFRDEARETFLAYLRSV